MPGRSLSAVCLDLDADSGGVGWHFLLNKPAKEVHGIILGSELGSDSAPWLSSITRS